MINLYPSDRPPMGSVAALVDLDLYYRKIGFDWNRDIIDQYQQLIRGNERDAAWNMIENYIINHLLGVLPLSHSSANTVEAAAANRIILTN